MTDKELDPAEEMAPVEAVEPPPPLLREDQSYPELTAQGAWILPKPVVDDE